VPFITAGHPLPPATVPLLLALERAGAAAIELGIPFSDPLADGSAIQRSSQVALESGVTVSSVLAAVAEFHQRSDLPIVLMSYINPVLAHGVSRFAAEARDAGVSGVILTDLPPEERPDVWSALAEKQLDPILLIAPTTGAQRRRELARASKGFVYCVSRTGVTGAGSAFATELASVIEDVRRITEVPVGVGFGVDGPDRAREVARMADAVIVGAALCERIEAQRANGLESAIGAAERFAGELAVALTEVRKSAAGGDR
jgi:tryptophan synthase alpha chain